MPLSITGGYLKGRAVNFSAGKARPTSAKLRQALFNILGPIEGLTFCDLFAGTGIVGFEAISRGVSSVSFVESDPISARAIKTSLNLLAIPNRCVSIFTVKTQKWLSADNQKYDLIFADPPFIEKVISEFLEQKELVLEHLSDGGILIVQLPSRMQTPEALGDRRKFGDDSLVFIQK